MIATLAGSNSFTLRADLGEQIQSFIGANGDLALEQIDAEEASFDRIREALQSMPFLSDKKLVVIRNGGANKDFTASAQTLLGDMPDTTDLLLVEPGLDKRTAYAKYLQKQTNFTDYKELDENGLARWLSNEATRQGGALLPVDARYLVTRVGAKQELLSNELAKLLSYNAKVTRQSIDLLTESTPQSTVFNLLEAAFNGNTKRALQLYREQRQLGEEPQKMLSMIIWQLHILAVVKTAGSRNSATIAAEAKISPYVVQKSQTITRGMKMDDVKALIHATLQLDVQLKSQPISADEALQNLLIHIST